MALNIGIDFGTSTIYVTRWNDIQKCAEYLPNITKSSREKFIENVIYYESKDSIIIGERAKIKGVLNPQNMVSYVKRYIEQEDWSVYIQSLDRHLTAADVIFDIFSFLKNRIEELHGGETIESVVLSVPFAFGIREREIILSSAKKAGLNVIQLIDEPISAGISYGFFRNQSEDISNSKNILIFDLGGGTLDIAILKVSKKNEHLDVEVLTTGGDKYLGGKDIDDIIFKNLCKFFQFDLNKITEILPLPDIHQLELEAKYLKENLSESESEEFLTTLKRSGHSLEVEISVNQLNQWISEIGFTKKIENILIETLSNIDLIPEEIDDVILVGGTTKIPLIQTVVSDTMKQKLKMYQNPAEMVGEGNGLYCGSFISSEFKFNLIYKNNSLSASQEYLEFENESDDKDTNEKNNQPKKTGIKFSEADAFDYFSVANNQFDNKNYGEAILNYKKTIDLKPEYAEAYFNLGLTYFNQKRYKDAIVFYKKYIDLNPKDSMGYNNLGATYYALKKYQKAKALYEKAKTIDPNNSLVMQNFNVSTNQSELKSGLAHYDGKNYKQAILYLEQSLNIYPELFNDNIYFRLAYSYWATKEYEKSICYYTKMKVKTADTYFNIGVSYHHLGKYDDAIIFYQKSLELNDLHLNSYYNLGVLYFHHKNELIKAKNIFCKILEINPDHQQALNIRQIIEQKLQKDIRQIIEQRLEKNIRN